ncbi:MAG: hypothetical protein QME46_01000 [Thermoanaerobacteraceae bacterium]|nr:hypothetical protein [Thermoanaerobacteraceae bacterium]
MNKDDTLSNQIKRKAKNKTENRAKGIIWGPDNTPISNVDFVNSSRKSLPPFIISSLSYK